jgi:CRISPR-associated endonuclease Cas1
MATRDYHNRAVLLTCIRCGSTFHPFKGFETSARYCSRACNMADRTERLAALRAEGHDPAHGGKAAEKRRAALARRRATGERIGVAFQRAEPEPAPPPPEPVPLSLTPKQQLHRDSLAYLAAGNRYEGLTAKLLATTPERDTGQMLVLAGYGAGLRVERDALIVTEGHTHYPQTPVVHTLWRGMHDVSRIVCLNPKGSLTFPAIQWCAEQNITLLLLGHTGELLSTLTPEASADAGLRRRQYLAEATGQDIVIGQELLRRKLQAQRATLVTHPDLPDAVGAVDVLDMALAWLRMPELPPWLQSVEMLRTYEGRTAHAYFSAWGGWPLRWSKGDARKVPPHWRTARDRSSPVLAHRHARHAVDPLNAMLNYSYALLEGQCRQALASLGFDVACGFLHADRVGRDSLVYDLMECERGTVDGLVLDFLRQTTLHSGDITSVSDGSCRLHPQLARAVVAACRVAQDQVDAHARWLRDTLLTPPQRATPPIVPGALRTHKRPNRPRKEAAALSTLNR